jgi:signal peptidase I
MPTPTPEQIIRPFLLYGGLVFTVVHRAVMVGLVLLFVHLFVVTIVPVRGNSMYPTLADGTYILVDQISPLLRPLSRGQIVAFRNPLNLGQKFIKRIVGLPGETLAVAGGKIFFEPAGRQPLRLLEPYLPPGLTTEGEVRDFLGQDEFWMLGDNRPVSSDSRFFGPVPAKDILGRAWLAVWPFSEIRLISHLAPIVINEAS